MAIRQINSVSTATTIELLKQQNSSSFTYVKLCKMAMMADLTEVNIHIKFLPINAVLPCAAAKASPYAVLLRVLSLSKAGDWMKALVLEVRVSWPCCKKGSQLGGLCKRQGQG
jgi:hypothetical protein